MALHNTLSKEECLKRLAAEPFERVTISFYRYMPIADPKAFRDGLFEEWNALQVFGRVYVAEEGINAQISVPEQNVEAFKQALFAHAAFKDLYLNLAIDPKRDSFYKLTLKVKRQIVADDLPADAYDLSQVGKHLTVEEFNQALDDANTVVIDMRNFYESRIGRFDKALCPDSNTFKEELQMVLKELQDKKDKKILMYCTGGIRCEKASAFLKKQGFEDVNQLKGGVIRYLREAKEQNLPVRFHGKNYVFDERTSELVTDEVLTTCDQCDALFDGYTNCHNAACNLLFIQCPACAELHHGACSADCQAVVDLPEDERRAFYALQQKCTYDVYVSRIRPRLKTRGGLV